MDPGTAAHRLRRLLMFSLVVQLGNKCFRCGKEMTSDDFSVAHKVPWLDSEYPVRLFFDLNNVSFSHKKCNVICRIIKRKSKAERLATRRISDKKYREKNPEKYKKQQRKQYLKRKADPGSRDYPKGTAKGERHGHSKITSLDVLEMRRRYSEGETQFSIAVDFGLSRPQIGGIVNRKQWSHVP